METSRNFRYLLVTFGFLAVIFIGTSVQQKLIAQTSSTNVGSLFIYPPESIERVTIAENVRNFLFPLEFRASKQEDITINKLFITVKNKANNLEEFVIRSSNNEKVLGVFKPEYCGRQPENTSFTFFCNQGSLTTVKANSTKKVNLWGVVKHLPNTTVGRELQFIIRHDQGFTVQANGKTSQQELVVANNDSKARGEYFVGTRSAQEPTQSIRQNATVNMASLEGAVSINVINTAGEYYATLGQKNVSLMQFKVISHLGTARLESYRFKNLLSGYAYYMPYELWVDSNNDGKIDKRAPQQPLIPANQPTLFEIRGNVRDSKEATGQQYQLAFETGYSRPFSIKLLGDENVNLQGLAINGNCPQDECSIHLRTTAPTRVVTIVNQFSDVLVKTIAGPDNINVKPGQTDVKLMGFRALPKNADSTLLNAKLQNTLSNQPIFENYRLVKVSADGQQTNTAFIKRADESGVIDIETTPDTANIPVAVSNTFLLMADVSPSLEYLGKVSNFQFMHSKKNYLNFKQLASGLSYRQVSTDGRCATWRNFDDPEACGVLHTTASTPTITIPNPYKDQAKIVTLKLVSDNSSYTVNRGEVVTLLEFTAIAPTIAAQLKTLAIADTGDVTNFEEFKLYIDSDDNGVAETLVSTARIGTDEIVTFDVIDDAAHFKTGNPKMFSIKAKTANEVTPGSKHQFSFYSTYNEAESPHQAISLTSPYQNIDRACFNDDSCDDKSADHLHFILQPTATFTISDNDDSGSPDIGSDDSSNLGDDESNSLSIGSDDSENLRNDDNHYNDEDEPSIDYAENTVSSSKYLSTQSYDSNKFSFQPNSTTYTIRQNSSSNGYQLKTSEATNQQDQLPNPTLTIATDYMPATSTVTNFKRGLPVLNFSTLANQALIVKNINIQDVATKSNVNDIKSIVAWQVVNGIRVAALGWVGDSDDGLSLESLSDSGIISIPVYGNWQERMQISVVVYLKDKEDLRGREVQYAFPVSSNPFDAYNKIGQKLSGVARWNPLNTTDSYHIYALKGTVFSW